MRSFAFGAIILSALITLACSGTQRREAVDLPDFEQRVSLEKIWDHSIGDPRGGILSPVGWGNLVCGAAAYSVSCVNDQTGRKVHEIEFEQEISGALGVADAEVFLGGEEG
ncbi:hypothetical protein N8Z26_06455, partial [Burkholderiales bacterium]|nr:hypothetical protein [Burkholderiales bacterium]